MDETKFLRMGYSYCTILTDLQKIKRKISKAQIVVF